MIIKLLKSAENSSVCVVSGNTFFFSLNYTNVLYVIKPFEKNFRTNFAFSFIRKKLPFSGQPPFSSINFVHKHVRLFTTLQKPTPIIHFAHVAYNYS